MKKVKYKNGRQSGMIYTLSDGRFCYLDNQNEENFYTDKHKTLTNAIRDKTLEICISNEIALIMQRKGAYAIGIRMRRNDDIWITNLKNFLGPKSSMRFTKKGFMYRKLPITYFKRISGKVKI